MAIWVTADDYVLNMGQQPYTSDEMILIRSTTNAVSAFISRVRPDVEAPQAITDGEGRILVATQDHGGEEQSVICQAALELAKRWYEKRGSGQVSSFQELGMMPMSGIDKDISEMLQIGRSNMPVIA